MFFLPYKTFFRLILTSLCLCGWMHACVYIITLSINNCKMYLLDSLYKQKKLLNTNELHAEHRTGCVPMRNKESQLWGMCNLAVILLLLKCKNKVTIHFSFKGPFWFLYIFFLWNVFGLKKTRLTLKARENICETSEGELIKWYWTGSLLKI